MGHRRDTRPPRSLHQDRRHRRPRPIRRARSAARRTTRCGRADTVSWTARRPRAKPGQRLTITATPAPNEAAAAHYYPAIYWYSMLKIPDADQFGGKSSIPPRLTQTAVDQRDEEHRLRRLPSARPAVHADDSGRSRHVRVRRRRLASSRAVGSVRSADAGAAHRPRRDVVRQLRRLDGSHREGRAAVRQAAAAPGRRAQHRRHAARLDERQAVPSRSDRERSALPHRERVRTARRLARVQLGHAADSRSGEERGHDVQGTGDGSQACR